MPTIYRYRTELYQFRDHFVTVLLGGKPRTRVRHAACGMLTRKAAQKAA